MNRWRAANPGGEIIGRDLMKTDLPFVTAPWLKAYFTPPEQQSAAMKAALRLSDQLVRELLWADHVVIATPVYNYNIPAALKAWIDHIVRKGMTLGFEGEGLVENTRATVLLASGGVYTKGSPIRGRDIASYYLRLILEVIGITEVTLVAGGGAKAVDMGDQTMDGFVSRLQPEIDHAVRSTAETPVSGSAVVVG